MGVPVVTGLEIGWKFLLEGEKQFFVRDCGCGEALLFFIAEEEIGKVGVRERGGR